MLYVSGLIRSVLFQFCGEVSNFTTVLLDARSILLSLNVTLPGDLFIVFGHTKTNLHIKKNISFISCLLSSLDAVPLPNWGLNKKETTFGLNSIYSKSHISER